MSLDPNNLFLQEAAAQLARAILNAATSGTSVLQGGFAANVSSQYEQDVTGVLSNLVNILATNPTPVAKTVSYNVNAVQLSSFNKVWHVATSGNNSNPGTGASPFLTIGHAALVAQPGDAIFIHRGTYHETVAPLAGLPGKPVTYIGERGPSGEYLTIVDPTVAIAANAWTAAPEVGSNVWKATLGFSPGVITYNGQTIPRLGDFNFTPSTTPGFTLLAAANPYNVSSGDLAVTVNMWAEVFAIFGWNPDTGTTYIRFADNTNPNSITLRTSSAVTTGGAWTFGFDLYQQSYITIRDLQIQGAYAGIRLSDTHNCSIINNYMQHGLCRIYAQGTVGQGLTTNNTIQGNEFVVNHFGYNNQGAYDDGTSNGSASNDQGLKEYFYTFYKFTAGNTNTACIDIQIGYAGLNNLITQNNFHNGAIGVYTYGSNGVEISNNYFHDMSDDCVTPSAAVQNTYGAAALPISNISIHDNTFYNVARGLRWDQLDIAGAGAKNTYYVYRNTFHNPSGLSNHLQFHYLLSANPGQIPPQVVTQYIFIYHNNFGDCHAVSNWGGFANIRGGLPNGQFINNIFSNGVLIRYLGNDGSSFASTASNIGVFSYNWCQDDAHALSGSTPAWLDSTNLVRLNDTIWPHGIDAVWPLPIASEARQAGIDLSRSYVARSHLFSALQGMIPGYFPGAAPDLGALLDAVTATFQDRLSLQSAVRYLRETGDRILTTSGMAGLAIGDSQQVRFLRFWDKTTATFQYAYIDNGAWVISGTKPAP